MQKDTHRARESERVGITDKRTASRNVQRKSEYDDDGGGGTFVKFCHVLDLVSRATVT